MNAMYYSALDSFAKGELDWLNDDVRAVLVDSAEYTPDVTTDQFLSDVPSGGRVADAALTGRTVSSGGVCDADDTTFSVQTGDEAEYIVVYALGNSDASSRLIAFFDTATGLPVTPAGGEILVEWSNGVKRLFKL